MRRGHCMALPYRLALIRLLGVPGNGHFQYSIHWQFLRGNAMSSYPSQPHIQSFCCVPLVRVWVDKVYNI